MSNIDTIIDQRKKSTLNLKKSASKDDINYLKDTKLKLIDKLIQLNKVLGQDKVLKISHEEIVEEKYLNLIFEILRRKDNRTLADNQIIQMFLQTLTALTEIVSKSIDNENCPITNVISSLSYILNYEHYKPNSLIFKTGDKANKIYVILKGSVDVLMPIEKKVNMTESDFVNYLTLLKNLGEKELLQKVLFLNRDILDSVINSKDFNPVKNNPRNKSITNTMRNEIKPDFKGISSNSNGNNAKLNIIRRNSMMGNLMSQIERRVSIISNASEFNKIKSNQINYDGLNKNLNIPREEYIKRIKAMTINPALAAQSIIISKLKIISVSIFEYACVANLLTGQVFGDVEFDKHNTKRIASVITNNESDTYLGVFNKDNFRKCIKEIIDKVKKVNVNFILSNRLFFDMNKENFTKNNFIDFVSIKISRGFRLVNENEDINALYFTKEGEYNVTFTKSLADLTEIIKQLDTSLGNDYSKKEKLKCQDDKDFKKFYEQKIKIHISIIKGIELIGLDDLIHQGKSLVTVECNSAKTEIMKLDYKIFQNLLQNYSVVKNNKKIIQDTKKEILLEKLLRIREIKLMSHENMTSKPLQCIISNNYNENPETISNINKIKFSNKCNKNQALVSNLHSSPFEKKNNFGTNLSEEVKKKFETIPKIEISEYKESNESKLFSNKIRKYNSENKNTANFNNLADKTKSKNNLLISTNLSNIAPSNDSINFSTINFNKNTHKKNLSILPNKHEKACSTLTLTNNFKSHFIKKAINRCYLNPDENEQELNTELLSSRSNTNTTNNPINLKTKSFVNSLMKERAKVIFDANKMQLLRKNRYKKYEDKCLLPDTYIINLSKKEKLLNKKEQMKLMKTDHNMFRFVCDAKCKSTINKQNKIKFDINESIFVNKKL